MSALNGNEFYDWLDDARRYLPPKMKVSEARLLFERKIKEEEELKHEKG